MSIKTQLCERKASFGSQTHCERGEYYKLLEDFVQLCETLVKRGLPYLTVVLCHELYRFLYPVEPYASFSNDNPVDFITKHIKSLIETAMRFSKNVVPYVIDLKSFDSKECKSMKLEKETSELYSKLWANFDSSTLGEESLELLKRRLPKSVINENIINKRVLDMGCGSGRYSVSLAKLGAKQVIAVDIQRKSFGKADKLCKEYHLCAEFHEGNILELPFEDCSFDFVFCNGVLHHTTSIEKGLRELSRVLKRSGKAFLYLYAAGGIFWTTRNALRGIFKEIPIEYTKDVLHVIGVPSNRFIFCDTWFVPVEIHTKRKELQDILDIVGLKYKKIIGHNPFDLDNAIESDIPGAKEMWGDGEHRYILKKR